MNTIHKILILLALSAVYSVSSLADDIKVAPGQWKTMFSYRDAKQIEPSSQYVFVVSNGGIYYYDKSYREVKVVSKNAGISTGTIEKILFLESKGILLIVHSDLTIDFYDVNKDKCFFTDKTISSKDVVGKTLRSIVASADGNSVFLATDFGIIKYYIPKREVAETYYIGDEGAPLAVKSLTIIGDTIFALTANNDIRCADVKSNMLTNYLQWKGIELMAEKSVSIACHASKLVLLTESGLYRREGDSWEEVSLAGDVPLNMSSYKGGLVASRGTKCFVFKEGSFDAKLIYIDHSIAVYDAQVDRVWFDYNGLSMTVDGDVEESFSPDGPLQNNYYKVVKDNGKLLLVGCHGWTTPAVLSIFENGEWTDITGESLGGDYTKWFYSAVDVVPDVKDKSKYYVPTWCGVFAIRDGKVVERYGSGNSTLVAYSEAENERFLTECAWMDENGYLFVTNTQAADLIHVMSPEGKWTVLKHHDFFAKPYAKRHIRTKKGLDVISSEPSNNYVASILFLDTKGTPDNQYDDKTMSINNLNYKDGASSESVTPARFYALAEDLNGDVWVGTEQGPFIFKAKTLERVSNLMNEVVRPKITREDDNRFADYLLSSDNIYAIAVDGQNRKWIGTGDNGLYLVSEDGTEIIEHHTAENSLLPSNNISSLYFDGKTGYLYVLTDSGLCVYGTDTSEGKEDYSEIAVFPNPVRPEYNGDVIIQGLVENSNVRITDAKGNMVENAMSNGGTYIWSARRNDGTRVATGIYNIFVTTQDGTLYEHKKVAVVK